MSVAGELRALLGERAVLSDDGDMQPYLTDWRGLYHGSARAVVLPSSTGDVAAIVRYCAERGIAVVPQGGNTGLAAGATPVALENAIVVSLGRMRRVRAIDAVANTISVDAGCVLSGVRDAAAKVNRLFPLSIAAEGTAQVGGLVATNAGGSSVLRYGTMRALVLGLEVVMADGTPVDGMRALRKDNAGYDWKQLFIGSEGTLGVITGAVLKLVPRPAYRSTALLSVASIEDAMIAFSAVQSSVGDVLSACELFSDVAMQLRLDQDPSLRRPLEPSAWYVLLEASASLPGLSDALESALDEQLSAGTIDACVVASSPAHAGALWEWRESITESERRAGASAKHDVSVPISAIPAFVREASAAVARDYAGARVLAFGHIGDGNVHFNVVLPPGVNQSTEINDTVHTIVNRFAGSVTAEHGIGRYRTAELVRTRSAAEIALMRTIKRALDPHGIMNPGAVIEAGFRGER